MFERSKYKCNESISRARINIGIISSITWISLNSLFWVAFILYILKFSEDYIRSTIDFLQPLSEDDKKFNVEQLRLYAQLLTAIFSIYFATIGIILTSGYTRLRLDIIQLLTTEQVGSIYSRILVFAAIFCLCVTTLQPFGYEPGVFVYFLGSLFTFVSSLALFPLGQRLFNFFDLNLLVSSEILPRIARHIEGAANPKNSIHLANHHSQKARMALMQLSYIDDRMKREKEGFGNNLPALTDAYSLLLLHYLQQKHRIDQQSYWFPRRQKHNQWFFAGDTSTSIALQTSSQLIAEEKTDHQWLENEITDRLASHIELALKEDNLELGLDLIAKFSSRISTYANQFHFNVGMREIIKIKTFIEKSFTNFEADDDKKSAMRIGIVDAWSVMGSNLCIETLRRMIALEQELEHFFKNDDWTKKSILNLPAFLQVELKFIVEYVDFENRIEGVRLSMPKYIQQLAIKKLLLHYAKILPVICDFHKVMVPDFIDSLAKLNMKQAATQVALASLHSHWKLPYWFEQIDNLMERYKKYEHYHEESYSLPKINTADMIKDIETTRENAIAKLAKADLVEHIFDNKHNDQLPDHFGQIYFELAESCITYIEENDIDKLKNTLPMFILLSSSASDSKFTDPSLEVNDEYRLHLISSSINDLAAILGFAILYGAYFDNLRLTKMALHMFDLLVQCAPDKNNYLKRMLQLSNIGNFSMRASPRDLIRINWKIAFERRIRNDGFGNQMRLRGGKQHKNKIIREFINSNSDAAHLFFANHILPQLDKIDFNIDYRITSLASRLNSNQKDES